MPHSSRKKNTKSAYQKRVQLDDSDGWTHVTTTRRSQPRSRGVNSGSNTNDSAQPHDSARRRDKFVPAEVPPGFTLELLEKEYARYNEIWTGSECWKRVKEIVLSSPPSSTGHAGEGLESKHTKENEDIGTNAEKMTQQLEQISLDPQTVLSSPNEGKITNCVCLGLGSFVDPISRKQSLFQLVALQSILQVLRTRYNISKVYAQDPVFNHLDIEFLEKSCNVTVLADPKAFEKIEENTFLYAPHCERTFLLPGLKEKKPALSISNTMESLVNGPISASLADEELDIARSFLDGQSSTRFPDFEPQIGAFNDMSIYVRTEAEKAEG